jgi:hypothetical protein
VAARPPLIPPADHRKIARQVRAFGRVILVIALLASCRLVWNEWRRTEPTPEELMPGTEAAEARQVGVMYGLFARDARNVWLDLAQPYPAAAIITVSGTLVLLGCSRLARRHETEGG